MTDLPSLVIVGAGGLGREVAALVEARNDRQPNWELIGFVDDDQTLHSSSIMGYPVVGDVEWLSTQSDTSFVIAIGQGEDRQYIAQTLDDADINPVKIAHPSVSIHRSNDVGRGAILLGGSAPTVNVEIGRHVIVDQQVTIGHDCVLRSFVTVHPGANISGSVTLNRGVRVGAGAVILPGTSIGPESTVGAGAVVTDDIPPRTTVAGVPARPISE